MQNVLCGASCLLVSGGSAVVALHGQQSTYCWSHAPVVADSIVCDATAVPAGYRCAYEIRTMSADRVFYVPGVEEASWNKVSASLPASSSMSSAWQGTLN